MKKKLTVIAPAYNEAEGISDFYAAVTAALGEVPEYTPSMLFVVDGGTDATFDILSDIAKKDPTVGVLKLSRNFGPQTAILAGIDYADADAIITMDSDMQHPPALIPRLVSEFEKGFDVVNTHRERTENIGFFRRMGSDIFYRFINLISDVPITENACDFRIMSKQVARVIRDDLRERTMFLRGLMNWIGFRQTAVSFSAAKRAKGKSKLRLPYLISFALFGIVSFSKKPLRAASVVGALFALFGFAFAIYTIFEYFTVGVGQPGFATLVVLLSIFGAAQLMFLGIIGEYIGAIFDEVKARPRYIVETAFQVHPRKEINQ